MEVLRLVDVGARDGIDPRWKPFHSILEVIAFEPDPAECARLNEATWPYKVTHIPAALGATDAEAATLNICRAAGCSSLLRPNQAFCRNFAFGSSMEVVGQIPVVLSRMDSTLQQQPDVIKIDTQGTELDVLHGAGTLLDRTLAVELEVEFVHQYERQALFADIDVFMRAKGFWLRGLRRTYWRNAARYTHSSGGQLVHGDALYIRPDMMDCPKGHAILAAYRQSDLLAQMGAAHLITKKPLFTRALGKLLAGYSNRELRRFIDGLRPPTASDWHDPDFF